MSAIPADFKAGNHDVKAAIALDLSLQAVEESAFEFGDLSASQAGHMDVVPLRSSLVKMLLTLHVHEIKLVHQAMSLEEAQRAINRYPVDVRIQFARMTENLAGIEMLFSGLNHA